MTQLQIYSDLHLEFAPYEVPYEAETMERILILAGDICIWRTPKQFEDFFKDVCERFKQVLYVAGNHEYYDDSIKRAKNHFMVVAGKFDNLHILQNDIFEIDNVKIIGATLWTDFNKGNPLDMHTCKYGMADFNCIRTGYGDQPYLRRLKPEDVADDFRLSRKFIFDEVYQGKQAGKKTVVVTHHAPSFQSIPARFKGDSLNCAFASNMDDDIFDSGPDLWIHGHIHDRVDYKIGGTRILSNPRGYIQKGKTEVFTDFVDSFVVEM
jgi:predicted phosphodiesterase